MVLNIWKTNIISFQGNLITALLENDRIINSTENPFHKSQSFKRIVKKFVTNHLFQSYYPHYWLSVVEEALDFL